MLFKHFLNAIKSVAVPAVSTAIFTLFTPQIQAQTRSTELKYDLKPREIAKNVFIIEGANDDFSPANGCNIINTGFILTSAGVLVINTGPSKLYGQAQRQAIERLTQAKIAQVIHLNLHPDYFLGNQAFADVPRHATPLTRRGIEREAKSYEDNMYRLCGDWMLGTETLKPSVDIAGTAMKLGEREFELIELSGHTDSDLVLLDKTSGVVFAGGLAFSNRIPTTPHAKIASWLPSLSALKTKVSAAKILVPSHGPVRSDLAAIDQTQDYLQWLHQTLAQSAKQGLEMNEVLALPLPERFRSWAAATPEFLRNVTNLYPAYEQAALKSLKN